MLKCYKDNLFPFPGASMGSITAEETNENQILGILIIICTAVLFTLGVVRHLQGSSQH